MKGGYFKQKKTLSKLLWGRMFSDCLRASEKASEAEAKRKMR